MLSYCVDVSECIHMKNLAPVVWRVRDNSKNLKESENFGSAVKVWIDVMGLVCVLESKLKFGISKPLLCQFYEILSFWFLLDYSIHIDRATTTVTKEEVSDWILLPSEYKQGKRESGITWSYDPLCWTLKFCENQKVIIWQFEGN